MNKIMKIFISFLLFIMVLEVQSQDYSIYDISINYNKCDLTGKETEYYILLNFNTGKIISEEIYDSLKFEFDSIMMATFDNWWLVKKEQYRKIYEDNENKSKEIKIETAKIKMLKAQIEYLNALNEPIDSSILAEFCDLSYEYGHYEDVFKYCQLALLPSDTTIIMPNNFIKYHKIDTLITIK